jgi:putative resolvase
MKLAAYAKLLGISYPTARRMWQRGEIPGYQLSTGTVIVNQPDQSGTPTRRVAIYARASNNENKKYLETQAERLVSWCNAPCPPGAGTGVVNGTETAEDDLMG